MKRIGLKNKELHVLAGIIVFGFLIRIISLLHHLPEAPHIDEVVIIHGARSLGWGGFDPRLCELPYFIMYLLKPILFLGKVLLKMFPALSAYGFTIETMGIILGRMVTICVACMHMGIVYLVGGKVYNRTVGLGAALLIALNPLHISFSSFLREDIFSVFSLSLSFLFVVKIYKDHRRLLLNYSLAGISIGLAMAAKYYGVLGFIPLGLMYLLGGKKQYLIEAKYLCSAVILSIGVFILFNPHVLLYTHPLFIGIKQLINRLVGTDTFSGWLSSVPISLFNHFLQLPHVVGWGVFFFLIGAFIFYPFKHSRETTIILVFLISYFTIISLFLSSPARYLLPIIDFIVLLSACFFIRCIRKINSLRWSKKIQYISVGMLWGIMIFPGVASAMHYTRWLMQPETLNVATQWIETNVSGDTRLLLGDSFLLSQFRIFESPYNFEIADVLIKRGKTLEEIVSKEKFDYAIVNISGYYFDPRVYTLCDYLEKNYELIYEIKPGIERGKDIYHVFFHPHLKIFDLNKKVGFKTH